jgi:hypothetical protein
MRIAIRLAFCLVVAAGFVLAGIIGYEIHGGDAPVLDSLGKVQGVIAALVALSAAAIAYGTQIEKIWSEERLKADERDAIRDVIQGELQSRMILLSRILHSWASSYGQGLRPTDPQALQTDIGNKLSMAAATAARAWTDVGKATPKMQLAIVEDIRGLEDLMFYAGIVKAGYEDSTKSADDRKFKSALDYFDMNFDQNPSATARRILVGVRADVERGRT